MTWRTGGRCHPSTAHSARGRSPCGAPRRPTFRDELEPLHASSVGLDYAATWHPRPDGVRRRPRSGRQRAARRRRGPASSETSAAMRLGERPLTCRHRRRGAVTRTEGQPAHRRGHRVGGRRREDRRGWCSTRTSRHRVEGARPPRLRQRSRRRSQNGLPHRHGPSPRRAVGRSLGCRWPMKTTLPPSGWPPPARPDPRGWRPLRATVCASPTRRGLIGKTNMDEFAWVLGPRLLERPTRNPTTPKVPGGSRGLGGGRGARLAPLGLGSDTGGSIASRRLLGVVGMKPTTARPRYGSSPRQLPRQIGPSPHVADARCPSRSSATTRRPARRFDGPPRRRSRLGEGRRTARSACAPSFAHGAAPDVVPGSTRPPGLAWPGRSRRSRSRFDTACRPTTCRPRGVLQPGPIRRGPYGCG